MKKILVCVLFFIVVSIFPAHGESPMVFSTVYRMDIKGGLIAFLGDVFLSIYPKYRRYRNLGFDVSRFEETSSVAILDVDRKKIGFLDGKIDGDSFLKSPESDINVEFTKEVLVKIHSLFEYVMRNDNISGAEHIISYAIFDKKEKQTTYYSILLVLKGEVVAPIPGVDIGLCPSGTKAWQIALWQLKSPNGALTRQDFQKIEPASWANGYVLKEGAMRGAVLGLEIHKNKSKEYVLLTLIDISSKKVSK